MYILVYIVYVFTDVHTNDIYKQIYLYKCVCVQWAFWKGMNLCVYINISNQLTQFNEQSHFDSEKDNSEVYF